MNMSSQLEPLQRWFDKLEKRERQTVVGGAIILAITIFYLAAWDPIFGTLETERQRNQSQRQLLTFMQDASNEISRLRSSGGSTASRFKNQSILSLVELSATSAGIKQFIKKQESDRSGVKVQLEKADFDRLVAWINDMQQKYAIQASKIHIEAEKEPGAVNARVTLERVDS
jgi:general secretion pathway protein M